MAKVYKMTLYVCDLENNLSQSEIETLIRQNALDGCTTACLTRFAEQVHGPSFEFDDDHPLNKHDAPIETWEKHL